MAVRHTQRQGGRSFTDQPFFHSSCSVRRRSRGSDRARPLSYGLSCALAFESFPPLRLVARLFSMQCSSYTRAAAPCFYETSLHIRLHLQNLCAPCRQSSPRPSALVAHPSRCLLRRLTVTMSNYFSRPLGLQCGLRRDRQQSWPRGRSVCLSITARSLS